MLKLCAVSLPSKNVLYGALYYALLFRTLPLQLTSIHSGHQRYRCLLFFLRNECVTRLQNKRAGKNCCYSPAQYIFYKERSEDFYSSVEASAEASASSSASAAASPAISSTAALGATTETQILPGSSSRVTFPGMTKSPQLIP